MRELKCDELQFVTGGTGSCSAENSGGNTYGGVTDTSSIGQDIINVYEGLVMAMSHIIERVANSISN